MWSFDTLLSNYAFTDFLLIYIFLSQNFVASFYAVKIPPIQPTKTNLLLFFCFSLLSIICTKPSSVLSQDTSHSSPQRPTFGQCYCFILELWRGNCRNDSASSPINTIFKYASLLKIMKFNFITQIWGIHQIFWKSVNLVKSIEASQHFKCSVQNKHIFQNTFYFQFDINFGNQIKLN